MSAKGEGHSRKDEKSPKKTVTSSLLRSEDDYVDDTIVVSGHTSSGTVESSSGAQEKRSAKSKQHRHVRKAVHLRPARQDAQGDGDNDEGKETLSPLPRRTLTSSIVELRNSQRQLLAESLTKSSHPQSEPQVEGDSSSSLGLSNRPDVAPSDTQSSQRSDTSGDPSGDFRAEKKAMGKRRGQGGDVKTTSLYPSFAQAEQEPAAEEHTPVISEKTHLAQRRRKKGGSTTESRSVDLHPRHGSESTTGEDDPSQETHQQQQRGIEVHRAPASPGGKKRGSVSEKEKSGATPTKQVQLFPGGTMTTTVRAATTRAPELVTKATESANTSGLMSPEISEVVSDDADDKEATTAARAAKTKREKAGVTQSEYDPSTWVERTAATPSAKEQQQGLEKRTKHGGGRTTAELLAPTEPAPVRPSQAEQKTPTAHYGQPPADPTPLREETKDEKPRRTDAPSTFESHSKAAQAAPAGQTPWSRQRQYAAGSHTVTSSLSEWVSDVLQSTVAPSTAAHSSLIDDDDDGGGLPSANMVTSRRSTETSNPKMEEQDVVVVQPQDVAVLDKKPKRSVIDLGLKDKLSKNVTQSQRDLLAEEGYLFKDREIVVDEEIQKKLRNRKRFILLLVSVGFLLLAAIGAILGYILGLKGSDSLPAEDVYVAGNLTDNSTEAPSMAPSQVPSLAPTTTREECIIATFAQYQHAGVTDDMLERMKNSSTPQNRAVKWLSLEDNPEWSCTDFDALRDRFAYATFYFSTNGPHWKNSYDWMSPQYGVCDWFWQEYNADYELVTRGIDCTDGNFVRLNLADNNLTGTIPPELSLVSRNFDWIFLPYNALSGSLPAVAPNWKGMTLLGLDSNSFRGTIPAAYGSLSSLYILNVTHNILSGTIPSSVGGVHSIHFFGAAFNRLTGTMPTTFRNLVNLTALDLGHNILTGDFAGHVVGKVLPRRHRLKYLWLSNNALEGTLPDLLGNPVEFPNFSSLDIRENPSVGGTIPLSWHRLSNLFELSLGGCSFTGNPADFFTEAADFPYLQTVRLSFNRFQGTIPSTLFTKYPDLLLLQAAENNMTGTVPPEIGQATSLMELSFFHNQLHGTIPTTVGNLVNMEYFSLGGNANITGTIPTEVGQMTSLRWLDLREDSLTGTIPSETGNLRNLTKLLVDANDLTGTVPESFSRLDNLVQLEIGKNTLTGDLGFLCPMDGITADCDDASGEPQIKCECCSNCCNETGSCFESIR